MAMGSIPTRAANTDVIEFTLVKVSAAMRSAAAWRRTSATLLAAVLLAAPALGGAILAPEPAPHISRELGAARLAGSGDYSWFGLAIYTAELWVGERGYARGAPQAAPFVLDLRYARALDGQKIAAASAGQMQEIGAGTPAQRGAWLTAMNAIFPNVEEGSHISAVYRPAAGVRFYLDGKVLGEVTDPAFGPAFFAIWLGPASTAGALRERLLLGAAPPG